jgi:FKBP-type peptidyl-prolyl cis-trans isomerase
MAKPHQRAIALIFAILFFASSVGVSLFVIWQIVQEQDQTALTSTGTELTQEQIEETIKQQEQPMTTLKGTILENYTAKADSGKLEGVDIVAGTGEEVKEGATVTAHYTGAYGSDGTIFESSRDGGQPIEFPLSGVIAGWTQGVPGMKVGGTRRLVIPGGLAYGDAPAGYTQGSTQRPMGTLIFDIEITAVTNP